MISSGKTFTNSQSSSWLSGGNSQNGASRQNPVKLLRYKQYEDCIETPAQPAGDKIQTSQKKSAESFRMEEKNKPASNGPQKKKKVKARESKRKNSAENAFLSNLNLPSTSSNNVSDETPKKTNGSKNATKKSKKTWKKSKVNSTEEKDSELAIEGLVDGVKKKDDNISTVLKDVETSLSSKDNLKSQDIPTNEDNVVYLNEMEASNGISCSYCGLHFRNQMELRSHCQTEAHQMVILSDEGKDWKFRPPPRGLQSEEYSLCPNGKACRYGSQCIEAHSPKELTEWQERFEYRKMKVQRAKDKELYGKTFIELLLDKWLQASVPDAVMSEQVSYANILVTGNLTTTVLTKESSEEWRFSISTRKSLRAVALLQDTHRSHFAIRIVECFNEGEIDHRKAETYVSSDQEWIKAAPPEYNENKDELITEEEEGNVKNFNIIIKFQTNIYGTFRQSVVFDFGIEPKLVKHLCVDVVPVTESEKLNDLKKDLYSKERWDETNAEVVRIVDDYNKPIGKHPLLDGSRERKLLETYPSPNAVTFVLTQSTITDEKLTQNNYRSRMHELLCVEEMARRQQISRFNIRNQLHLAHSYLLPGIGTSTSTAKYSCNGEIYAMMNLTNLTLSEDTAPGRLILNNCLTVLLDAVPHKHSEKSKDGSSSEEVTKKRKVYEAEIEDKGKNVIYIKIPASAVEGLQLKSDSFFDGEIQFQLNRLQYCEWHYAIDSISDYKILFPETFLEPSIPWTPSRQWKEITDSKLNVKQREAVVAITTPTRIELPPILIIGPFGTGKTYTLAQAIKQLLTQSDTRVLVCTHSNSAADLYIQDYLHPYVEAGHEHARPLRIYYYKRWVNTVSETVQKYCLIESTGSTRQFRLPELSDIEKHRVIVVTLSIAAVLPAIGVKKDFFTHILLDEAAQAMECEAIMPLALANSKTRIVLAGDHMQLSPELFSPFAKERNLHLSLLERLYDHYPSNFPCKILLTENYRAHEAIIKFTSELFYEQKLISHGKQPAHEKYFPLTFFTSRGEDEHKSNSTSFYNNSEVYEIVDRVRDLKNSWPAAWGKQDDSKIGIMTPYSHQVVLIRSELRRQRLAGVSVERVLNVQGKQFRAVFLSTVRTRRTVCTDDKAASDEFDYGFLSNSKLLNTAITRAQSLVAVVGDPLALCSIGRCRKIWEHFISICHQNKSLYGITWERLRSQLDAVELRKIYSLNPLAPEFIPRRIRKLQKMAAEYAPSPGPMPTSVGPVRQEFQLLPPRFAARVGPMHKDQNLANPNFPLNQYPQFPGAIQQSGQNYQQYLGPPDFRKTLPAFMSAPNPFQHQQFQNPTLPVIPYETLRPPAPEIGRPLQNFQGIPLRQNAPVPPQSVFQAPPQRPLGLPAFSQQCPDPRFSLFPPQGQFSNFQQIHGLRQQHFPSQHYLVPNQGVSLQEQPFFPFTNPVHPLVRPMQSPFVASPAPRTESPALLGQNIVQQPLPSPIAKESTSVPLILGPRGPNPSPRPSQPGAHNLMPHLPLQLMSAQSERMHLLGQHLNVAKQNLHQEELKQLVVKNEGLGLVNGCSPAKIVQDEPINVPNAANYLVNSEAALKTQPSSTLPERSSNFMNLSNFNQMPQEDFQLKKSQEAEKIRQQRTAQIAEILLPLVSKDSGWPKLIAKNWNLLDVLESPILQEVWLDALIQVGEANTAKQFTEFIYVCHQQIANSGLIPNPLAKCVTEQLLYNRQGGNLLVQPLNASSQAASNPQLVAQLQSSLSSKPVQELSHMNVEPKSEVTQLQTINVKPLPKQEEKSRNPIESGPTVLLRDLDPSYMFGADSDMSFGGASVWAVEPHQLQHSTQRHKSMNNHKNQNGNIVDSDDSGDELLSSINRQLDIQD